MKRLLLVAKRRDVLEMYAGDLRQVFAGYLEIEPCLAPDGGAFGADSSLGQADLVLITNPYSFPQVRRQMREDALIINLNFAFEKERVALLRRYPVGTETLVCMNYYSSAHQAVSALYEAGVSNLNLYIHYPGNRNTAGKKFALALTAGPTDEIPDGIPEVFDLGRRRISLTTLLDVAVRAGVVDGDLERAIARYADTICTPDDYLAHFYEGSGAATMQLRTIMECIDYGIVVYGQDHRVINYNRNFLELFGLSGDITGRCLADFRWKESLRELMLSKAECRDRLFVLAEGGRSVLVSKEKLNKRNEAYDLYILLAKDITALTNLENSLQQQVAKRGHVARHTFGHILGGSPAMTECVKKAERIAAIDKPTLIIGESGTGKELFAQSIHNASVRARFPFVAMNCASIPSALLESELFGYEEGAFTGARKGGKAGLFQMAHKGTLFLDEIGELSLPTQAKLLRVLEEKEIMKVGGGEIISVDVRIIAATNRDLNALMDSGDFRLDLYYRLNTLIINVPPLRQRRDDIPLLAQAFLRDEGAGQARVDPAVWAFFMRYQWKGNVRELRNCVEYMASIADGPITPDHLPDYIHEDYRRLTGAQARAGERAARLGSSDRQAVRDILVLLKQQPMGRRGLLQALQEEGADITEYRLRGLLAHLSENGHILFGRGRAGCAITAAGEELLLGLQAVE
ncbi:sigma 54-interacting transcriptional regulator [Ruminococcaceae bacterium OttesenSCG-928-A11]|nr:sigma 54-interacting transcriptional regulator [Ruminococcaceae bacterium OttesenSCG-928-A11]